MQWFGPAPFSAACDDCTRAATPTTPCAWCGEGFTDEDEGYTLPHCGDTISQLPYHIECHLRQLFGSVAHIEHRCSCYGGGEETDPPGLTRRQAALAATDLFFRLRREAR
jgi:hypothetical protein